LETEQCHQVKENKIPERLGHSKNFWDGFKQGLPLAWYYRFLPTEFQNTWNTAVTLAKKKSSLNQALKKLYW
jgi:hypothetical protein